MASEISPLHQALKVTDVRKVVITPVIETGGQFVRSIRILGTPLTNDVPLEILEIVITSEARDDLEIDAPAQVF